MLAMSTFVSPQIFLVSLLAGWLNQEQRAAPWVSYRRGIDLGWRPIESSLRADPVIDPPQADVELDVVLCQNSALLK